MKLLVDMNLAPAWCELLNAAGHLALHWSAIGRFDAPDTEIMAHAVANGFVVLTHDLDFGAILAASNTGGPSVIQIRADTLDRAIVGPVLLAALDQLQPELEQGALVTVEPGRTRARVLPLRAS